MKTEKCDRVIALCDDQPEVLGDLERHIRQISEEMQQDFEIYKFCSGEELLEEIEKISIVFLDIEMDGMDGIETGRIIKQKKPECKIIMASGKENRFKEAFRIQAFRFITKPFEDGEIKEALEAVLDSFVGTKTMELYRKRITYQVRQLDIKYIKAFNGYTEFAVQEGIFRRDISLDALEEVLDMRIFYRINRQYIINMHWIQKYSDGMVVVGDKNIRVPRRKKSDFTRSYIDYDIKYRRG